MLSATKTDTTHPTMFSATNTDVFKPPHQRTVDVAITGGAGFYSQGTITPFQATANADFYAQTSDLDLTAGFHVGFSDPSTESLSLGLRFAIKQSEDGISGFFADAGLLFIDNGRDTQGFETGFRAALAARNGPIELRFATELRKITFDGQPFEAWGGIELGFVINLLREDIAPPTPKDSLKAELRYIATTAELEELEQTSSSAEIDRWLDKFWQVRNVTGSVKNDARIEYMNRVQFVNEKYGTPRMMGVNTDQGRVYLLYGKPDRIERTNSTFYGSDQKYELWVDQDRVKGNSSGLFLFVWSQIITARGTYEGHGEFREIYSNVAGEPSEGIPTDLPLSMQEYIEGFR